MKYQNSFFLTIVFVCIYMAFVPAIEAWQAKVIRDMTQITNCRLWAEDANGNRIAGDGKGEFHECSNYDLHIIGTGSYEQYWIHARVEFSVWGRVYIGPYNSDACFRIHGAVDTWDLDEVNMSECDKFH